jgi:hypothetical protein
VARVGRTDAGGLCLLGDNGCHDILLDNGDDNAHGDHHGDSVVCDDHDDAPVGGG